MPRPVALWALAVALVVLLVVWLLPRATSADHAAVQAWLTCDGCTRGQPGSVAALFTPRAVPLLEDALFELPSRIRADEEAELRAAWALTPSPSQSETDFVAFYVTAIESGVQLRAVIALGDLGKVDILQEARNRHDAGSIRYADDVLAELDRAIAYNTIGLAPPGDPNTVEISAAGLGIQMGQNLHLRALVRDASGAEIPSALVTWETSNSGVATVTSDPPQSAILTTIDNGSVDVRADAGGGVETTVTISVNLPPAVFLTRASGNAQTDTVGNVVANPLVARVGGSAGPVGGVSMTWTVIGGDAVFVGTGTGALTENSAAGTGLSSVQVELGPTAGTVLITVAITGDAETYRIRAIN